MALTNPAVLLVLLLAAHALADFEEARGEFEDPESPRGLGLLCSVVEKFMRLEENVCRQSTVSRYVDGQLCPDPLYSNQELLNSMFRSNSPWGLAKRLNRMCRYLSASGIEPRICPCVEIDVAVREEQKVLEKQAALSQGLQLTNANMFSEQARRDAQQIVESELAGPQQSLKGPRESHLSYPQTSVPDPEGYLDRQVELRDEKALRAARYREEQLARLIDSLNQVQYDGGN